MTHNFSCSVHWNRLHNFDSSQDLIFFIKDGVCKIQDFRLQLKKEQDWLNWFQVLNNIWQHGQTFFWQWLQILLQCISMFMRMYFFSSVALFITFSDSAHDTCFLHKYPVEKIARTPMRGFWKKPLQRKITLMSSSLEKFLL